MYHINSYNARGQLVDREIAKSLEDISGAIIRKMLQEEGVLQVQIIEVQD